MSSTISVRMGCGVEKSKPERSRAADAEGRSVHDGDAGAIGDERAR